MARQFPILVIDDEPQVADILERSAKEEFPEAIFTAVTSYDEAVTHLERLAGLAPKLILLDIDLHSSQDGLDLLKLLRQHPQGRLLPVIILSSNTSKCEEAYQLGASTFFKKPYRLQRWKDIISLLRLYWYSCVSIPELWVSEGIEL